MAAPCCVLTALHDLISLNHCDTFATLPLSIETIASNFAHNRKLFAELYCSSSSSSHTASDTMLFDSEPIGLYCNSPM